MVRRPLAALALSAASLAALPAYAVSGVDAAYMDAKVAPCEDFWRYANGAYDRVPIPGAYAAFGVNQEIDDRNWAILQTILTEAAADKAAQPGSARQRIGDFFATGMDEAAIGQAGLQPLRDTFARIAGLTSAAQLPGLLAFLHGQELRGGFAFYVGPDDKDSQAMLPQLMQGGLGLPERDYYLRDDARSKDLRASYVKHPPPGVQASAERVLALETQLARASKTLVDLRDPEANYHKLTRADLAKQAPGFDWEVYLRGLGLPATEAFLNVGQPEFLKAFAHLTTTVAVADWQAYLRWHVLRGLAPALPKAFEDENFAFYGKVLSGRTELLPRWKRILKATDRALGEDLGVLYVRKAFSAEAKHKVEEMIRFHQDALRASIGQATWMGEATRKEALRKLQTMRAKVGYPDKWKDYSRLAVSRQPFATNVLAGYRWDFQFDLAKLGKPVDRSEWHMTPHTNNASYDPTQNEIVLPAGILQPPFFDVKADEAVNYGALASTIGHEILHALDDEGSQYDADGNLKNWWTPADRKAYDAQTLRVVQQFDAYEPLPGLHILGKQTLGENLADIGGLKISHAAWQRATAGKVQPKVDGLTPEQRFFVAFAQGWRTNERPESLRLHVQSDVHSPIRFRVLGAVSALEAFTAAFQCRDGTPMHASPERRFAIW
jgi:putative endopeptidase